MRIVKLADLSEEERKKVLEEQKKRIENNNKERQQLQKDANEGFKKINPSGQNNTTSTTTYKNILNAMKSETQKSQFKSNNKMSLWDSIKNMANSTGKIGENTWLGLKNGIYSSQQTIGRNLTNQLADRADVANQIQQRVINSYTEKHPNEKEKINKAMENSNIFVGDNIRKNAENVTKQIQTKKDNNTKKIVDNTESMENPVLKYIGGNIAPSVGQMLPGFVGGPVGTAYFMTSAAGNYYDDAKQRGMSEEQANMYSGIMGMIEGSLESVGAKLTTNVGKQLFKKNVKGALIDYGLDIGENFLEESIVEPISELVAQTTAGKEKANWNDIKKRMLQSGIDGAVVSMITGGASGLVGQIASNKQNTSQQINTYKDYNTNKVLDDNSQNWLNKAQNIINGNNTSNLQQNSQINQNNIVEQQIIQENNKNAQNENSEQINNIPKATIKDFNESAKQYNIDYNNEDLKEINQMYKKRGITAYFDENTFNNNNDAFSVWKPTYDEQGNISGREVVFNPNAKDSKVRIQELAIHELGHDLDLNEVQDMILKDASRKENWEGARKSLENTYREAYKNDGINITEEDFNKIVDEEATMSILQRELGSQEYVNRLVNQNQSIAKKIYNWVVDKLNKFTGGKNEKIFWADVKNKFETAYNQEFNKNESNLKYSVIYNKDGSFNRVKINDNIFENTNNKSISKTIYNYLTEHINEYADIIESGQRVYLGKDLPGEYTYSKSAQSLPLPQKMAKGRAVTELKEIINNATNREYSNYKKQKHVNDAKYGFYKYDTKFSFEQNGKEQVYTGTILIRNDANGKKYLYDILNIKKIGSNLPPVASNSQKSSAKNGGSNNLPNNSLPSTKENVNSKPLQKYSMQESENNSGSFNLQENKKKQLEIIEKYNPIEDDYHTGIRSIDDIKTLQETLQDSDWADYDEFNPDYTRNMANEAIKTGKMMVYSSYPIKQGTFVSPSKMEAESYSGNGKIYSKEINIGDVAWIDPTQGQYANINQKYALPTKEWKRFVEDNYQKQGTGKNLKEYSLPIKKPTTPPTKGENINWNEIERPDGKIRKHYRSIIESSNTTKEAKTIAKELMGTDTYVPETNKGQLAQADYRISTSSPEKELESLMNRATQGGKIDSVDIAVGERLIQYYSKIGDKTNLQEAIQATAMAGTSAGQTVQALAMLNHQTPQGQATWIQRSVDKMNNELAKRKGGIITKNDDGNIRVINKQGKDITDKVNLFHLTPDMTEKIVNSKDKTEMYDNIDQVYKELGQQVPLSTMEKIDSWRYFSMLANPKTHIRNMLGNFAMGKTQRLKDKLAGGIEDVVSVFNKDMERTKTLRIADEKTKEFAKNDVLNSDVQSMMELNENKYNPQSRLQNSRRTFKSKVLENTLGRLFNWNDTLLEAEDALGLKSAYKKALTDYLTANKIDVDNITDKQLSKARSYAVQQAKEATFHQANSLATFINQASKNNKLVKGAKDAILPFVKTPLNVAKAGLEYNPTGLAKTILVDTVRLRKGDIRVNKYIDNLSKGLTGTGIAVLGYALADMGILKASGGDDDKKEKYDEALGKQTYSITIGDKTYSLDWLSPVGIPLFVGAEVKALKDSQKREKSSISSDDEKKYNQILKSLENLVNAMSNSMSPMSEMSMISGLTSALSSYEKDKTSAVATNAIKSYVNQFVPTALGQVARTTDDYERSTTSTKTGALPKAIDQTKLQIMSKVPGLRQKLPTKTDIWGNEQKSETNLPLRIVNNFINPATVKNVNTSKVDNELDKLYNKTGESTILPTAIDKTYTIDGQKYRMTNEEYAKYRKNYGQTSYKLLDSFVNSKEYNKLTDEQKQQAIENIYDYAKEVNKVDYAKKNNKTLKTSTLYNTLEEIKQAGGEQSSYLSYIAKTKDINGEGESKKKIEVLLNSNYTDRTKEIIYKNTEGKNDKKLMIVDKLGLPINQYLKYKSKKFENDKDENGDTISGSKKQKVYDYLNSILDKDLSQDYKKIICKIEGINDEQYNSDIVKFVKNYKGITGEERKEILKTIGFKIDKDGYILTTTILPITTNVK